MLTTGNILCSIVIIFVTCAGFLKLIDLSAFEQSLESWKLISPSIRKIVLYIVPTCELCSGCMWALNIKRRFVAVSVLMMLGIFAGSLGIHLAVSDPPQCACFGALSEFVRIQSDWRWMMFRLIALSGVLLLGIILQKDRNRGT